MIQEELYSFAWTTIKRFWWDIDSWNFETNEGTKFCFKCDQGATIEKVKDKILRRILEDEDKLNRKNRLTTEKRSDSLDVLLSDEARDEYTKSRKLAEVSLLEM